MYGGSRAASLVVVGLVLALAGCRPGAGDEPAGARAVQVGEVVAGRAVLGEVSEGIEVRLPSGPARVQVRDGLRAVPEEEVPGGLEDLPAADDSRLVRLAWGREFLGYGSYAKAAMTGSDNEDVGEPVGLALTAGSERVEIPDVGRLAGIGDSDHVYVGIPRDAEDLVLEVTYDGVTQSVDLATGEVEAGPAAGLYDLPLSAQSSIGDGGGSCGYGEREVGLVPRFSCQVLDSVEVPYVDGHGWAGRGQTWLVVDAVSSMSLGWVSDDGELTRYRTRLRSWEVLADGVRPVGVLPQRLGNHAQDKRLLFAVVPRARHRVDFRATFRARPADRLLPGAPARPTVQVARTARVPAPAEDG